MASVRDIERSREAELLAADAIGDVIEHWGFRKALGRLWAVLYLHGEALPAAEIGERLQMSSGAVSMTLTELQRWGVVKRVHRLGERREFFEAETDFLRMIRRVINERERFVADSARDRLQRAEALLEEGSVRDAESRSRLDRLRRLLEFSAVASRVIEGFVSSGVADFGVFSDLLSLRKALLSRVASQKSARTRT